MKNKKTVGIIAAIVAVLLVVGIALAVVFTRDNGNNAKPEQKTTEAPTEEPTTEPVDPLIGKWAYEYTEEGADFSINFVLEFREDGTMEMTIDEEALKETFVALYKEVFGEDVNYDEVAQMQGYETFDEMLDDMMASFASEEFVAKWERVSDTEIKTTVEGEEPEIGKIELSGDTLKLIEPDEETGEDVAIELTRIK